MIRLVQFLYLIMDSLNFCLWNLTNLHIFRIPNINLEDTILHLKCKLIGILHTDDIDRIELLHCGNILSNGEKIASYVKNFNSFIFVIIKEGFLSANNERLSEDDLNKIWTDYNDVFSTRGFKAAIINSLKPDTIKKLESDVPDLLNDSIALSIIKDPHLVATILKPTVLKTTMKTHPALLLAINHLANNVLREPTGINFPMLFTDEDFSESDDIEIDYTDQYSDQPNVSNYNGVTVSQLANALQNTSRNDHPLGNHHVDMLQLPLISNSGVLGNQSNDGDDQDQLNVRPSLALQLRQMHELGLTNDLLNFRALEVAGGDVQSAVELILNGIID